MIYCERCNKKSLVRLKICKVLVARIGVVLEETIERSFLSDIALSGGEHRNGATCVENHDFSGFLA